MAARVRFKGDHLFILFTICAVIEANRHSAVAKISPTSHEKEVSDLEGETSWRRERGGCGASHFQMAHNAAHTTTNVVASISVVRYEGIFVPPVWSALRLAVGERIAAPCRPENFSLHKQERRPWKTRIQPMKKIARTLRTHRALILNYFRARKQFSSGVVEGLNNKAKLTMRKSYGFRTFHVTEIALYHALGKLPEPDVVSLSLMISTPCRRSVGTRP
jgi:hypothetical protein